MALKANLLSRMTDLSTENVQKHLAAMIYGKPGAGKTVLAIGLAKLISPDQEVLHVDTGEGWVSLDNHKGLKYGVKHFAFERFSDLNEIAAAIKSKQPGFEEIGTVVIDEFNTVYQDLLTELHYLNTATLRGELNVTEVDPKLYQPVNDQSVQLIQAFLDAKVNLILVCHERELQDHRKVKVIRPDFSVRAHSQIQRKLHITAHVTTEIRGSGKNQSYERNVQSHPSALVDAKSRIGGLPLSTDTVSFVQTLRSWLLDEEAPLVPEVKTLAEDELPTEGLPVAELEGVDADEDEPAFVG